MFVVLGWWLALATAAAPAPSPIATASPNVIATPAGNGGLVLPAVPALPAPAPPTLPPQPPATIAGTSGPFVGLSLQDALAMALVRNTSLAIAQSNRRIAGYNIVAAKGAYDLQFQIAPNYSFSQNAATSSFQSGPNGAPLQITTLGASATLSQRVGSGGTLSFGSSASRVNNNLTLNSYDPYYQTAFALEFTQPLLRGRAIGPRRRQLRLSKINASLSDDQALLTASQTIDSVETAYNDLIAAWKTVGIQEDALRQARAQSESNARLVEQGAAAPVDVVESDAQVDQFRDAVAAAVANVASLQNTLKGLVLNDPADPIWRANLVPTTPVTEGQSEPQVAKVVAQALLLRPEVAQLRDEIRSSEVDLAYDRDQTRPQVDLSLGITENGFAGEPTPLNSNAFISASAEQLVAINQLIARVNALAPPGFPPLVPLANAFTPLPPNTIGGLGTAFGSALRGEFPQYTIGATIGFPLRNRTAEATYAAAKEARAQLATQELALIQALEQQARNAVQAYRSARARLLAAGAERKAAAQVSASELRKFRAGESTTYLVLQRQVQLASARGSELQAQTDLANALVELERVSGSILPDSGVQTDALGTAPEPVPPSLATPAARGKR
ncbi:MAG: TolC family protein [Vulcanimicrobiaceae bacterium]